MISTIIGTLLRFLIPGGVLLIGTALAIKNSWTQNLPPTVLHLAPYTVAAIGILLGWRFNRSKLVFAILALFTVERLLTLPLGNSHNTIINVAGILLPLNFAYYTIMTERGFITARGMTRTIIFGLQPLLVFAVNYFQPAKLQAWLSMSLLNLPFAIPPMPINHPALISFIISFLIITLACVRRRSALENGFLWATVTTFFAFSANNSPIAISILLTVAGITLITGVIETAHTMAFRDELTGLPGRRALEEAMLKLGNQYAIAMVDIDFFKKFNDTYGHDIGDQVLRMVASRLAQTGGSSKAFRYGGEEFTILFNGKNAEEAKPHLERLRKNVEESGFSLRGDKRADKGKKKRGKNKNSSRKVSVTISIGVATPSSAEQTDRLSVIKAADKALYKAKENGRNRVVAA